MVREALTAQEVRRPDVGNTARWMHRMAYLGGEAPFVGWPAAGEGDGAACGIQGSSHHGVPWRSSAPTFQDQRGAGSSMGPQPKPSPTKCEEIGPTEVLPPVPNVTNAS